MKCHGNVNTAEHTIPTVPIIVLTLRAEQTKVNARTSTIGNARTAVHTTMITSPGATDVAIPNHNSDFQFYHTTPDINL